jgi:hypothetical protein
MFLNFSTHHGPPTLDLVWLGTLWSMFLLHEGKLNQDLLRKADSEQLHYQTTALYHSAIALMEYVKHSALEGISEMSITAVSMENVKTTTEYSNFTVENL